MLGAGMVGVCCALSLRRRGCDVVMIDRKEPGRETSFGNSGVFSRSSVVPINSPGLLQKLPVYALNRSLAVRWRASALSDPMWLARFLAECTQASVQRRSAALDALIRLSLDLNRQRIQEAGLTVHLRETGWLKLWRSADGPSIARTEAAALARFAIDAEVLDADGIARLEPSARRVFSSGLLIKPSASVDDPNAIVAGFAALYRENGGAFERAEVRSILRTTTGWRTETTSGSYDADHLVVALGPWSADVLRPLGYRVPMGFERGYHVHLESVSGAGPQRAVYDVDRGYVVSPMRAGARVTSGVELASRDAAPKTYQIEHAAQVAAETFRLGRQIEDRPWLGSRPTLPDSLPMIGPIPRERGLWAAFGHQHIGFSTGAGTGEIIAAAIAGEPEPMDVSAFAPARYLAG